MYGHLIAFVDRMRVFQCSRELLRWWIGSNKAGLKFVRAFVAEL